MSKDIRNILSSDKKFTEVAKVAFDSVDTDKSGTIDASELEKVMIQIASDMEAEAPTKEDVQEVLEHLDTDKSGKIDFNEFKILIRDVLEAMLESEADNDNDVGASSKKK
jgi:Ca2+-binding EF-hand superfamily protein